MAGGGIRAVLLASCEDVKILGLGDGVGICEEKSRVSTWKREEKVSN